MQPELALTGPFKIGTALLAQMVFVPKEPDTLSCHLCSQTAYGVTKGTSPDNSQFVQEAWTGVDQGICKVI